MTTDEPTAESLLAQLRATHVAEETRPAPTFIAMPDELWRALFAAAAALRARLDPYPRLVGDRIDPGSDKREP